MRQCESAPTGGYSLKLRGASEGRKVWRKWKQVHLLSRWKPLNLGLVARARGPRGTQDTRETPPYVLD